jgi:hypothetical protein
MKRIHRLLYPKGPSISWAPVLATAVFLITVAVTLGARDEAQPRSHAKVCPDPLLARLPTSPISRSG